MNANRRFLSEMLGSGIDVGTVTADDVLRHVTPEILAHHLPVTLKVKLLEASLAAEKMTPAVVVEALGIEGLAEHAPIGALWACLSDCARRLLNDADADAGVAEPTGDSGELKPNRSARPSSGRLPGRISALSPRSRPTPPRPPGRTEDDDLRKLDHEFDVIQGEDVIDPQLTSGGQADDETRPGDLSGRKL